MREFWTAALAMGAVAAGALATGVAATAEPIRIGVMSPHSGPAARVGEDVRNGVKHGPRGSARRRRPAGDGGRRGARFRVRLGGQRIEPGEGHQGRCARAITEDNVDILMFGWHFLGRPRGHRRQRRIRQDPFRPAAGDPPHLGEDHRERLHPLLQGLAGHRRHGRAVRGGHRRLEGEGPVGPRGQEGRDPGSRTATGAGAGATRSASGWSNPAGRSSARTSPRWTRPRSARS